MNTDTHMAHDAVFPAAPGDPKVLGHRPAIADMVRLAVVLVLELTLGLGAALLLFG